MLKAYNLVAENLNADAPGCAPLITFIDPRLITLEFPAYRKWTKYRTTRECNSLRVTALRKKSFRKVVAKNLLCLYFGIHPPKGHRTVETLIASYLEIQPNKRELRAPLNCIASKVEFLCSLIRRSLCTEFWKSFHLAKCYLVPNVRVF